jgi:PAS domain S-box-containing protein
MALSSRIPQPFQSLRNPLPAILISAAGFLVVFLLISEHWATERLQVLTSQRVAGIERIVSLARHSIDPVIRDFQDRRLTRQEALARIAAQLRSMTFNDSTGSNYIFLYTFDGVQLVQPFNPASENTPAWNTQGPDGSYIVRAIVQAARDHPEGSFVTYKHPAPGASEPEEKKSFVVGMPDLECCLGAGLYLRRMEQQDATVMRRARLGTLALAGVFLIPILLSAGMVMRHNRTLHKEVEHRKKISDSLSLFRRLVDESTDLLYVVDPESGRIVEVNKAACLAQGLGREEMTKMRLEDLDVELKRQGWAAFKDRVMLRETTVFHGVQQRRDGTTFPVEINIRSVKCEEGSYFVALARDITERQQVVEAIRESEARYRELVEHARTLVVRWTADGRITYINEFAEQTFGLRRREVAGTPIFGSFLPVDHDLCRNPEHLIKLVLASPQGFLRNECERTRRDGQKIAVTWTHQVEVGPDGKVAEVISIGADITDQKRARDALAASEAQFRSFVEQSSAGILLADGNGCIIEWNSRMTDITGQKKTEVLGNSILDLQLFQTSEDRPRPATRELMEARMEKLFSSSMGSGQHVNSRLKMPDGREVFVEQSLFVIKTADGRKFLGAVIQDVTESRRTEQALKESEARLRTAFENLPFEFWACDADGICILQNTVSQKRWNNLVGRRPHDSDAPAEMSQAWEADIARSMKGDVVREERTMQFHGKRRIFDVIVAPITQDSKVRGLIGVNIDITERKEAEAMRGNLEKQIRQAQKMEAIGTLAGGIAHDFNNIIIAIMGYTELARMQTQDNAEVQDSLGRALESAQRAADLVKQILTFSRQTRQERRPIQLQPVIKEAVTLLRSTLPTTIELITLISEDLPEVNADPSQINQVFIHLCTNAAEAMSGRMGRLETRLEAFRVDNAYAAVHPEIKPGDYVRLTVADNGRGMDFETLVHIFEPFFTTKNLGGGSGLGLSVAHGIIQEHEGVIIPESEPGKGSMFSIFLPAIPATKSSAAGSAAKSSSNPPQGQGQRILFVDDEASLCAVSERMLKKLRYNPSTVSSPQRALEIFRANSREFDLVMLDYTMPGMTGLDLATAILQIRPDIPVLLVSGFSGMVTRDTLLSAGIRNLVPKPFSLADLAGAVHKVFHPPAGI